MGDYLYDIFNKASEDDPYQPQTIDAGADLLDFLEFNEVKLPLLDSPSEVNQNAQKARRKLWPMQELTQEQEEKEEKEEAEAEEDDDDEEEELAGPQKKKRKHQRITHITVERNRRKQMNDNLSILKSLMPNSYVNRGDQASIVEGAVEFVKELQQLLKSLESQKQRKSYAEALSPRLSRSSTPTAVSSPRPWLPSPTACRHPLSLSRHAGLSPVCSESDGESSRGVNRHLAATSTSDVAQVEVKIAGSNVLLKTACRRSPGQLMLIITALQSLSLHILYLHITTLDSGTTVVYNFTLQIGADCKLSVDDLAEAVQAIFGKVHSATIGLP